MPQQHDQASMTKELNRVYSIFKKPFTRREFDEIASVSYRTVERIFGSWSDALAAAGLDKKFALYESVEQDKKSFSPEKEHDAKWQAKKTELLRREQQRRDDWLRKTALNEELSRQAILDTLATIEPLAVEISPVKLRVKETTSARHITLWVEISDSQIGTAMTSAEMGGLNKHNWTIWKDKLAVWKRLVIGTVKRYLEHSFVVDKVILAFLGDMVEGVEIFPGQIWQIDRGLMQQIWYGANDMAGAVAEIVGAFPSLHFHAIEVLGNHGRTGKKGERPYIDSADWLFQRIVEMQMLRVERLTNVTWHQNEAWFAFVEIYGWHHLLLHGDQGVSGLWSSRPTVNGLEKGVTRYNQMLQNQIHFVHAGHFHNDWSLSFNMSYMLINGSFIGTSKFSASKMVASSPAMQCIHVFDPDFGLLTTERLYLSEGPIISPVEPLRLGKKR